ncbi:hypothetical protein D3C86_1268490 [compost metagenome]
MPCSVSIAGSGVSESLCCRLAYNFRISCSNLSPEAGIASFRTVTCWFASDVEAS